MENGGSIWRAGFWTIVALAALTRLWGISTPPYAIFDEVYYATMANFYISGTPFVDTHPPAARLIFALAAVLGGSDGAARFPAPGTPYAPFPYIWLRAASGIAGIICVALLMLFTRHLTASPRAGLLAGAIGTLENALAAQSRVILPDIFLLMFGLLGLLFAIRANTAAPASRARHWWLAAAGIAIGCAIGVKISGAIFIAAAFLFSLARREYRPSHPQLLVYLVVLPLVTLYMLTLLHFVLLDAQAPVLLSIGGNPDAPTSPIFDALREATPKTTAALSLQRIKETTLAFAALPESHIRPFHPHAAASPWFSWPFMSHPILYDDALADSGTRFLALFGNPVIWWGGLIALAALLFRAVRGTSDRHIIIPLALSYACALGIFAVATRELFLYLYIPALAFLIILLAVALDTLAKRSMRASGVALGLIAAAFLFFAPYTYEIPLSEHGIALRAWLPDWNFTEQK